MATHPDQEPYKSQYPELRLPPDGWKSSIPPHLLDNADPQMGWLMTEMSKNTQATTFACQGAVDLSNHLRALNGRTYRNEKTGETNREDITAMRTEIAAINSQIQQLAPVASTFITVRKVAANKIVWIIIGINILFLLGYNRDVLPAIARYFFGS